MTSIGDGGRPRYPRGLPNVQGVQGDAFQNRLTNEDEYLRVVGPTPEGIALRGAKSSKLTKVPLKRASDYLLGLGPDDFVHPNDLIKRVDPSRRNK